LESPARIELTARLAIRLVGLPLYFALKLCQPGDYFYQVLNHHFTAVTQINGFTLVITGGSLNNSLGAIFNIKKLSRRLSRAPHFDIIGPPPFSLDALADNRGNYVRRFQIEVITRTIEVCR